MSFSRFILKIQRKPGLSMDEKLNGRHIDKNFLQVIKRERARADRGGTYFSIVVFKIDNSKLNGTSIKQLLTLLTKRLRLTDELGWINQKRIGVLLFNSGANDAFRFAAKICDELSQILAPLDFNVYTYPNDLFDFNDSDGNDGGRKNGAPFDDQNSKTINKQIIESGLSCSSRNNENNSFDTCTNAINDISPLFSKTMPVWKRCIDIIGASACLIIFSPIFLITGLVIKIVSPGPVFFKQERIGYKGRKFEMWKFRTMQVNADCLIHEKHVCELYKNDQPLNKLQCDSRIIPLGNFLRTMSLDELPQLINVLKGDMSLVGPRPDVPYAVKEYHSWHCERFDVVPGMTGLWQVTGKNKTSLREMMSLDIRYSRKISIFKDTKILFLTFPAVTNEFKESGFEIANIIRRAKKLFSLE
jgi:lipopolysaccharide/colanic/teichoic acid biosynthesis glycosyltransferase